MDRSFTRRGVIGLSAGALGWTALAAASGTQERGGGGGRGRPDFGGYLDDANNYDGEVVDMRGQVEATVRVGAGDSPLAFDPAAVHVDNGATVRWAWTGEGGAHSVVAEDGTFDSESVFGEAGVHLEHTFEEDGIYPYYCEPHVGSGMLGAVVVGTDYPRRKPTATPTATPEPTPEGEWLSTAPGVDWPSREFDAANRSLNPETTGPVEEVRVSGSIRFHDAVLDPVLADGTLFLSLFDDRSVAVDAATGERQWSRSIPGRVRAASGGRVYVTSRDGMVHCLDAESGDTRWTRQWTRGEARGLQVADGRVVAAVGDAVVALAPESGDRKWFTPVGGEVTGIAVADGTVYASGREHFGTDRQEPELRVTALDAATGEQQWSFVRESFPPTRPTVADGTVYVGSESHAVHAIDAADGTERWSVDLGGTVTGLAAVPADDASDAVAGTVYAGCTDYHLYAFDAESGEQQWRTRTRGIVNPPAVADGMVYANNIARILELDGDGEIEYDDDGEFGNDKAVHGFDGASGERLWTVELDEEARNGRTPSYVGDEPIVADGRLYIGLNTSDQVFKLYAISGESGRQAETGTTDEPARTTAGDGPGFTALAAALGMVGYAGWRRLHGD
jgi:halocyanin-like protein